jgi:hypothetical protein
VAVRSAGSYLVVAFFDTRAETTDALLAATIDASKESREGEIGMLALDELGNPEAINGERTDPSSMGVLRVIASALLGGVMPLRSHFFGTGSDLSTDDVVRFGAELDAGHAAVIAVATRARADRILVSLARFGGRTEMHHVSDRVVRRAASAVAASPGSRA